MIKSIELIQDAIGINTKTKAIKHAVENYISEVNEKEHYRQKFAEAKLEAEQLKSIIASYLENIENMESLKTLMQSKIK